MFGFCCLESYMLSRPLRRFNKFLVSPQYSNLSRDRDSILYHGCDHGQDVGSVIHNGVGNASTWMLQSEWLPQDIWH